MNHAIRHLSLLLLLLLVAAALQAAPRVIPAPPQVGGTGYILQDYESGQILAEESADTRMEPASLTKMMTAYAVLFEIRAGNIAMDEPVQVSTKAWRTPGSRMFIEVDSKVPVEKLLKGMIIQSGNDASVALAEHVAGSEETFATLMNQHAESLGLTGTHFVNATGLPDPEHYSTPRDLARLAAALIREFPDAYRWYSERKYTYNGIEQYNRNKLLWRDESVDGVKTGHTESAGYCLVTSAQRDGMRLISVVMGTESENARARESQKLLNYGFRFFETHRLYEAGKPLQSLRIWKGATETVPLGLDAPLFVTVPRGQYDSLTATMSVDEAIVAPLEKGRRLGSVHISLDGETLAERPLVALEAVPEGGLWQRLVDNLLLLFQ